MKYYVYTMYTYMYGIHILCVHVHCTHRAFYKWPVYVFDITNKGPSVSTDKLNYILSK